MKKQNLFKSMLLLCALVAGSSSVWAENVPYLTLTFPDDNQGSNNANGYDKTWTAKIGDFQWEMVNFNNNNWGDPWTFIKCGRKYNKKNIPSVATITTKSAIDQKIPRVVVSIAGIDEGDYNSIKMYVASNSTFTADLQTIEVTVPLDPGDLCFDVPNPKANMYYKLEFDTKGSTSVNGHTVITKVDYCLTAEPASSSSYDTITEIATINEDGTQNSDGSCIVTAGNTSKSAKYGYSNGLKLESENGIVTITTPSGSKNAKVEMLNSAAGITLLKIDGASTPVFSSGNSESGYKLVVNIPDSKAGEAFTIERQSGSPVIYCITLTYEVESATKLYLTTTDNMDGWRAFYDGTQDYTLDANTKAYVVTAKSGTDNTVELTKLDVTAIPHGEAVILKTSAGDHKMVLTKTTGVASLGTNLLAAATGSAIDGYRLGYGNIGGENAVGFFKYTGTPAAGTVYIDKSNVNTGAGGAHGLSIVFDEDGENGDVTAIKSVNADQQIVAPRKVMKDGRIVVETNEGMFSLTGARVK